MMRRRANSSACHYCLVMNEKTNYCHYTKVFSLFQSQIYSGWLTWRLNRSSQLCLITKRKKEKNKTWLKQQPQPIIWTTSSIMNISDSRESWYAGTVWNKRASFLTGKVKGQSRELRWCGSRVQLLVFRPGSAPSLPFAWYSELVTTVFQGFLFFLISMSCLISLKCLSQAVRINQSTKAPPAVRNDRKITVIFTSEHQLSWPLLKTPFLA